MERKILLSKSYKVILKYMDKTAGSTASSMAMAALACQSRLRYLRLSLVCTAPSAAQKKNSGEDIRPIHLSHRGISGI